MEIIVEANNSDPNRNPFNDLTSEEELKNAERYNNEIISKYKEELEWSQKEANTYLQRVYDFEQSLAEFKLLNRQLSQIRTALFDKITEPRKGGYIINGINNNIENAHSRAITGYTMLNQKFINYLEIVKQQIEKLTPKRISDTFVDNRVFPTVFLYELHEKLNNELFNNTFPQFYMALNDPQNKDYSLDVIDSLNKFYYFLDQLAYKFDLNNFAKLICEKQGIDFEIYTKKKATLVKENSPRATKFKAKLDKILKQLEIS